MTDLRALQSNPSAFRESLNVDADGTVAPFADVMDDWQRADFEAMDPAWQRLVGQSVDVPHSRAWLERGRGSSKTTDLAVSVTYALFASQRRLSGLAAAADRDQARLLRDAIAKLVSLNPWLRRILDVQQWRVTNTHTDSTLEIIASDVASSYGQTPDFLILDEVTHWPKRDLFDSLISSAAKRRNCVVVSICNAGWMTEWQWPLRETIRIDSRWYFHSLAGLQASWITKDRIDEQSALLPTLAFERLWLNRWSQGGGDALLASDINRCFREDLSPLPRKRTGYDFVAGLDLGIARDASALVVLGVNRKGTPDQHARIRLAYTRRWKPTKGRKIKLSDIEDALLTLHERYKFQAINYDPWQSEYLAQRLRLSKLPMVELTQTGANLQRVASAVLEVINDHRLDAFVDEDLRQDLLELRVEERSYGFRLTSPNNERGHGDSASAFGFAMLAAQEIAAKPRKRQAKALIDGEWTSGDAENDFWREAARARAMWSLGIHPETGERFEIL